MTYSDDWKKQAAHILAAVGGLAQCGGAHS